MIPNLPERSNRHGCAPLGGSSSAREGNSISIDWRLCWPSFVCFSICTPDSRRYLWAMCTGCLLGGTSAMSMILPASISVNGRERFDFHIYHRRPPVSDCRYSGAGVPEISDMHTMRLSALIAPPISQHKYSTINQAMDGTAGSYRSRKFSLFSARPIKISADTQNLFIIRRNLRAGRVPGSPIASSHMRMEWKCCWLYQADSEALSHPAANEKTRLVGEYRTVVVAGGAGGGGASSHSALK